MSPDLDGFGFDFDVLVVGSGFGGSVTALRLTEKGYRVGVLEAGARFEDDDFASRHLRPQALPVGARARLLRHPADRRRPRHDDRRRRRRRRRLAGLRQHALRAAARVLQATRSGRTSPTGRPSWRRTTTRPSGCSGVVDNPVRTPADDVMEKVANDMGVGRHLPPDPGRRLLRRPGQEAGERVADPFFGGEGPDRNACLNCGECMSGCRHNAKNTLVKNYLYLAEKRGAKVLPLTHRHPGASRATGAATTSRVRFTKAKRATARSTRTLTAEHVVFAAASLGTQKLLHRMKDEGHLPRLSDRLGFLSRTNSESILGAIAPKSDPTDYSYGRRDHLELPPRRGHPHRAGPLRQGLQHDGDDADRAHRRRRRRAPAGDLAQGDVDGEEAALRALRPQALVGAHRHRAGHAEPRQLDHDLRQARPVHRQLADDLPPGPRRAQPDLDPGRQRGRTPDRRRCSAAPRAATSASRSTCR